MERPKTENLTAWITGKNLNVFQKADAVFEYNKLLKYVEVLEEQLRISGVSKRYFLFECINADKQKLKKLIIAPDRETAIADIEINYPYITKWFSSEELNVY